MTDIQQFEEGAVYRIDELPENRMTPDGQLEWVGDGKLALATADGQLVTFEWSHVEATDVKYLDRETGEMYDRREEIPDETD